MPLCRADAGRLLQVRLGPALLLLLIKIPVAGRYEAAPPHRGFDEPIALQILIRLCTVMTLTCSDFASARMEGMGSPVLSVPDMIIALICEVICS